MLFAQLPNVCPHFMWALRAVLFSYVLCPAVNVLPLLWALRAIICFDLLFALLLRFALVSCVLCRQLYLHIFFALLLTICPFCGLCGLQFALICYLPCFLTFALFLCGLCGQLCKYFLCPAVNDLPLLWALRAIICVGLLFALLLTPALFSCGLCGQFSLRMFFALL